MHPNQARYQTSPHPDDSIVSREEEKRTSRLRPARLLEAPPRFELGVRILQTLALPLGYGAVYRRGTPV